MDIKAIIRAAFSQHRPEYAHETAKFHVVDIGSGMSCRLYRVYIETDEYYEDYTLKWMHTPDADLPAPPHPRALYQIKREAAALRRLQQVPSVVECYGLMQQHPHYFLLMPYMAGWIDVLKYIKQCGKRRSPTQNNTLTQNIMTAVRDLHAAGWAHNDLKPENFLVHPETLEVKLIDFGAARDAPTRSVNGTLYYFPPEYLAESDSKEELKTVIEMQQGDLWSLGLTIFRLWAKDDYTVLWYTHTFWPPYWKKIREGASDDEQTVYQTLHREVIRGFLATDPHTGWEEFLSSDVPVHVKTTLQSLLKREPKRRQLKFDPS